MSYKLTSREDLDLIDRGLIKLAMMCPDKDTRINMAKLREIYVDKLLDKHKDLLDNFIKVIGLENKTAEKENAEELYKKFLSGELSFTDIKE